MCSRCSPEEFFYLETIKSYHSWNAGETIAWAGEQMAHVGSIVSGVATLSTTMADGRRQMVGLLMPSDFLGRPGRDAISFDVVAATDVTLCMFKKTAFEKLMKDSPNVGSQLLKMTLDELDSAREWMLLLGRKTAREKIATLFVMMSRRHTAMQHRVDSNGLVFPLHITREAMADYLGLTIETVSRQISALRRDGLIELRDHRFVHVLDFDRLQDRCAEDADGGGLG